ncbi:hypothetical protein PV721_23650 [Streptomyces sp. MB09-01]|uniref:hypothetical protein n=1 Tax=Streptomyces sp. MB09-01 TaxID=3028666 RepID=UPI0029BBAAE5|nr:hypothetical protein [Streptomyces sp. MB09-01]MDX3537317.1 hypothetical protein [Streptomyces sp. MB09-01]
MSRALGARHEVLFRRLAAREGTFTAGLEAFDACLTGGEPILLPVRSRSFAQEVADHLCAEYHGRLTRCQGEGEGADDSWR